MNRLLSVVILALAPAVAFAAAKSNSGTTSEVAYRSHPQSTSRHTHKHHANHHARRHHNGTHHQTATHAHPSPA
jgi:hypothetical protein